MTDNNWIADYQYRFELELEISAVPLNCSHLPVEIGSFILPSNMGKKASALDLWVVRHNKDGSLLIFDPDKTGAARYRIPCRFEPAYDSFALPCEYDRGKLILLAANQADRQFYSIYFNSTDNSPRIPEYGGLVGDGDVFIQNKGRLAVSGTSRPVWYGDALFGTTGLIVAGSYQTGIFFFQEISDSTQSLPDYICRGRLRDCDGNLITGVPTIIDFDSDGTLDMIVGQPDGTIFLYDNKGSNEKPIFATPVPLRMQSGKPIEIRKYLEGKYNEIRWADGTLNTRYPKMRIVNQHGHTTNLTCTPVFGDWNQTGRHDMIVGTPGNFLLYFRRTNNGFAEGIFLRDEKGEIIRCGCYPAATDWNHDGKPDVLCGNYHGNVHYLENVGNENGTPVFANHGPLEIERDVEYSFPLVCKYNGKTTLMVGNYYGEIKSYELTDTGKNKTPEIINCHYIEMSNAPIVRQLPLAQYADLNNDGKLDIVSGDVKGGLFFYKNIGTNRNPLFEKCQQLSDPNGPIKIHGGPDPITPDDGYSKVFAFDLKSNGFKDLIVGTGLGKIIVFENKGFDSAGQPVLSAPEILKDVEGNEIRCHHMSAPLIADWDGDGVPDLIVTGQKNVHYHPDDDSDPSQLRWYKGVRNGKSLAFMPYIPIDAQGDTEITYRPIPSAVSIENETRVLHVGQSLFRQIDAKFPQHVEFLTNEPWRIAKGTEPVICAYHSIAQLAKHDSIVVQGSCTGWLYAFHEAFLNNHGYPPVKGKILSLNSRDGKQPQEQTGDVFCFSGTHLADCKPPIINCEYRLKSSTQAFNPDDINSTVHENIPVFCAFTDSTGVTLPDNLKCTLQAAAATDGLYFKINCREPEMNRLICGVNHDNGPIVEYSDDRVELYLDIDPQKSRYYCWIFNAAGYCKEMTILRINGQPQGPWQIGDKTKIFSKAQKDANGWALECFMPFAKLGMTSGDEKRILCQARKVRNLYATQDIPALECKTSETFYWPGNTNKWACFIIQ